MNAVHNCNYLQTVRFFVLVGREEDGKQRWTAEINTVPVSFSYGESRNEAMMRAEAIALRVLAFKLEQQVVEATVAQR